MALTNHVLVRLRAVQVGKKSFRDYLVLGDDVVIASEPVALKYRENLERIGVGISLHKRILPSDLCGLEFARKLITKESNLSPLPVALLLQRDFIRKIQFTSNVVRRVLREGLSRAPNLDVFLSSIFSRNKENEEGTSDTRLWFTY